MARPYSDDLRQRAVAAVDGGLSRHQAAKRFSVGVSSVIRWVQAHRRTGSVSPKPVGGSRGCRIEGANRDWLLARIAAKPDLTLEEMRRKKPCTPRSKTGLTSPKPGRSGVNSSRRSM